MAGWRCLASQLLAYLTPRRVCGFNMESTKFGVFKLGSQQLLWYTFDAPLALLRFVAGVRGKAMGMRLEQLVSNKMSSFSIGTKQVSKSNRTVGSPSPHPCMTKAGLRAEFSPKLDHNKNHYFVFNE